MGNRHKPFYGGTPTVGGLKNIIKILKSGCKAESYRLAGDSMQVLLGFLTNIAAQLLKMTYVHRTEPETPASSNFN